MVEFSTTQGCFLRGLKQWVMMGRLFPNWALVTTRTSTAKFHLMHRQSVLPRCGLGNVLSHTSVWEQQENHSVSVGLPTEPRGDHRKVYPSGSTESTNACGKHIPAASVYHRWCYTHYVQLQISCLVWLCNNSSETTLVGNPSVIDKARYQVYCVWCSV